MNLVWLHSAHKGSELLLLLAIADNADDHGRAWPGIELLSRKTRLTTRGVQYALRKLLTADDPEVDVTKRGAKGRSNEYQVRTKSLRLKPVRLDEDDGTDSTKPASSEPSGNHQIEPKGASPLSDSGLAEVYGYWRESRGKTRSTYDRISEGRRKKIASRLGEFSAEDLKRAIDGVGCDPWPDRPQHDDITIIFRSHEQVEKFLDLADEGPAKKKFTPQEIARRAIELEEEEAA